MEEAKLTFEDDALNEIAKLAIERKTGARGLRSIMEKLLLDTMFDLPGTENVEEVIVKGEHVKGDKAPIFVYGDKSKPKKKDAKAKDDKAKESKKKKEA